MGSQHLFSKPDSGLEPAGIDGCACIRDHKPRPPIRSGSKQTPLRLSPSVSASTTRVALEGPNRASLRPWPPRERSPGNVQARGAGHRARRTAFPTERPRRAAHCRQPSLCLRRAGDTRFGAYSPPRAWAPLTQPFGRWGGSQGSGQALHGPSCRSRHASFPPEAGGVGGAKIPAGCHLHRQALRSSALQARSVESHVRRVGAAPGGLRSPGRRKEPQRRQPAALAAAARLAPVSSPTCLSIRARKCHGLKTTKTLQGLAGNRRGGYDSPSAKARNRELAQSDLAWRRESFTEPQRRQHWVYGKGTGC
ncbi:hypothetical protein TREES_T100004562 [Tupaia chinensis]|uniref:Uncharacterized protein n=1 Tax=Tupaia chinensis TaxID=246437 RepID=L9J9K9_TUPCH|nr:hypothetical protein TREES_T100004562 [Tupaia chinensis]